MGALDGLKILDFSTLMPGPAATMSLADMGADVLKVSSRKRVDLVLAGGNVVDGTQVRELEATIDRNKRSITLDLKKDEAKRIVKRLVSEYDIVVEQFRPGVMERLGLGYEELKRVNPRVIYVALTGYGQDGPLAMRAGHDINYLARSGLISYAGRPGQLPSCWGTQVADLGGGTMNVIIGILAAVISRQRTGVGQFVDISMYDCSLFYTLGISAKAIVSGYEPRPGTERTSGAGMYDYYETKDGRYFSVGAMEPKFWKNFCDAMGLDDLIEGGCNPLNPERSKEKVRAAFASLTFEEACEKFASLDACVEPVLNYDEVLSDVHANARKMFVDVPVEGSGVTIKQLASPIKFSATPNVYRFAANPVGHDTEDVLRSLGYAPEEICRFAESGVLD
ncbi:CaiB/BaiF CoA-transferase family protein [Slackia isoflavoniconvertens]|uniref:CaiB/BaiF CoA transferase family protein n=1 Tax=Slackia isoflavoniconvertens TaxID=572010 RepID=UPI002E761276|nr:CaiB/BaiF CoA-transferase family protein [Slackia isoflavoniconvertens]